MELSLTLQPWLWVPLFMTLAVLGLRIWLAHESGWRTDGDGWFFFIVWMIAVVPALLVGWIK